MSTEDHQDPVTSRARQRDQAGTLVAGHGRIVAEFFDIGQSRALPWARRPQAAALLAAMADPERGFDAIVVGGYERAFYGGQRHPSRPHEGKNVYIREDQIVPHLAALAILLACQKHAQAHRADGPGP